MPLGLFAGCSRTPTRKKSQIFKETATASSGWEQAEKVRCRKGAALKPGLEASENSLFRSPASFLAKMGAAGRRRLEVPSPGAAGRRAHLPCRLQMAKVE